MRPYWIVVALIVVAGCATDRFGQLETVTPSLNPAQIAELQRRARPAQDLGVRMRNTGQSLGFADVNELAGDQTVTLPLVRVPTATPREFSRTVCRIRECLDSC